MVFEQKYQKYLKIKGKQKKNTKKQTSGKNTRTLRQTKSVAH